MVLFQVITFFLNFGEKDLNFFFSFWCFSQGLHTKHFEHDCDTGRKLPTPSLLYQAQVLEFILPMISIVLIKDNRVLRNFLKSIYYFLFLIISLSFKVKQLLWVSYVEKFLDDGHFLAWRTERKNFVQIRSLFALQIGYFAVLSLSKYSKKEPLCFKINRVAFRVKSTVFFELKSSLNAASEFLLNRCLIERQ